MTSYKLLVIHRDGRVEGTYFLKYSKYYGGGASYWALIWWQELDYD